MALIAPSLLAADFARLGEALEIFKAAGASMVHVDVMDGHFVPEISVGLPVIESLRKATDLPLDIHLLIERPERFAERFVKAGADRLAIHAETTTRLHGVLEQIRICGAQPGVALNPSSPLELLSEVWGDIDFVNVLTAEPGLREQLYVPRVAGKVGAVARLRTDRRLDFAIQAEGGIGPQNLEELARAGADILVAGSAIFDSVDPRSRLAEMIHLVAGVRLTSKA
ncbi:MAG: ribulose-phosphate 3-epimerase [Terriglobia bacterium]